MSDTDQDTIDDLTGKIADLESSLQLAENELLDRERNADHWHQLYEAEHKMRLAAEDAYETLLEMRRSERPELLAIDLEIDRW